MDRWCEQQLWREWGVNTGGAELFGSATGLLFCFVPGIWGARKWTVLLLLLWACFGVLGVGTFIFHWVPHDDSDHHLNAFDWYPMVFTCGLLIVIYLVPNIRFLAPTYVAGAFVLLLCWMLFLLIEMNHMNPVILNAVLVAPPVLIFAFYTYATWDSRINRVWFLLVLSLTLWLINSYFCERWAPLALFHSAYHVTMAIALWEAACIGVDPE